MAKISIEDIKAGHFVVTARSYFRDKKPFGKGLEVLSVGPKLVKVCAPFSNLNLHRSEIIGVFDDREEADAIMATAYSTHSQLQEAINNLIEDRDEIVLNILSGADK